MEVKTRLHHLNKSYVEEVEKARRERLKRNAFQQRRRLRRKLSGICTECRTPAVFGKLCCQKHAERDSARSRKVYYDRKKRGWCVKCGLDKEVERRDKTRCLSCEQNQIEGNRLRKEKYDKKDKVTA